MPSLSALETSYYVLLIASLALFVVLVRHFRLPAVSFSTVSYFMAFVLAMLPGYNIARGSANEGALSRGFDAEIYFLYVAFSILFPISLVLGNIAGKRFYLYSEARSHTAARMKFTLSFIVIYSLAYLSWVPVIPLKSLLGGSASFLEVALERIAITHQLALSNDNLPFVFRYWRNIMQNLLFVVFVYFLVSRYSRKNYSKVFLIAVFLFLLFNLTFTLEKAAAIYALMALFAAGYMNEQRVSIAKLSIAVVAGISASMLLIHLFMGGQGIQDTFSGLIERLENQTGSVYVQIEYVRQNGFLLLRGIYLPVIGHLLGPSYYVDLSRWAYEVMFPSNAALGMVGSASGMALAELYFLFSWFGLPAFVAMMFLYGAIDSVLLNSLAAGNLSTEMRNIDMAFYIYFMTMLSLALTGSVFTILSIPFLFSPPVLLLIAFYCLYTKVSSISLRLVPR